ncbi:amidase [Larsenimonas rhizosphaerae]|uniref:Amidase n=1 Tax=Larsenimonas rhizosphaerae TaxID=2944682 RepID=A0AA41ZFV6_9GAMM|nr:amidase [Larsenimonas rhizosphaerae]MCM2129839.1 amidase [Larsenimonas rhizosphaerae]MCX2524499.1 amidase [Larsenimonas rhizosphaerae]
MAMVSGRSRGVAHVTKRFALASSALAFLLSVALPAAHAASTFSPASKSLPELKQALDDQRISAEALVRFYMRRIDRFENNGPAINALLRVNPDAIARARRIDRARSEGRPVGPLAGLPFIVKDNINVKGLPTTGGSVALRNAMPRQDATLVARLKKAGAIVLAKGNMTEFASSFGKPGYSSLGGTTRNPYNPDRYASGSSSGPAAGVAADLAAFGIGTDTEGSVRGPASVTGLVGLRPTIGLISRSGILPLSPSFDTPGPITRTVSGSAMITQVMAGRDPGDQVTQLAPDNTSTRYYPVAGTALAGQRIGVISGIGGANQQVDQAMKTFVARLERQGATVVPISLPAAFGDLWASVIAPVQNAEFRPGVERFLSEEVTGGPPDMSNIIKRCEENNRVHPHRQVNPERIRGMEATLNRHATASPNYLDDVSWRLPALRRQLHQLMDTADVTALAFPTRDCPAYPRTPAGKKGFECRTVAHEPMAYLATVSGFPEITFPMGMTTAGLPMGVSLLARPFQETTLFQLATPLEQAIPAPRWTPDLPLSTGWRSQVIATTAPP